MALFRYLAHAALVPALFTGRGQARAHRSLVMALQRCLVFVVLLSAPGCSQSLFVDGSGGDDGRRDGAPEPVPDGSPGEPDAGGRDGSMPDPDGGVVRPPDAGAPVDGGVPPDAGPRPQCPAPCVGDAYADYNRQQGGVNLRWNYVEVQPGQAAGEEYVLMSVNGTGFAGTGSPAPTIVKCEYMVLDAPCVELYETLALTTASPGVDVHFPGLMWTAPDAEQKQEYVLTGALRVASSAPAAEITMVFTRNGLPNVFDTRTISLTTAPYTFEQATPALVPGDQIVLHLMSSRSVVSVGVNLFVSDYSVATGGGSW
jgi:hypothetical protein